MRDDDLPLFSGPDIPTIRYRNALENVSTCAEPVPTRPCSGRTASPGSQTFWRREAASRQCRSEPCSSEQRKLFVLADC